MLSEGNTWLSVFNRFRFTIVVLVIVVVGALGSQYWSNRTPSGCKPVLDLLDFNTAQAKLIEAKSAGNDSLPTVAEDAAYEAWADGMAERAGKVTATDLTPHAVLVADLASQFVALLPQVRAEANTRAPGAPAPPVVYQMSVLNARITDQLGQLAKACKR